MLRTFWIVFCILFFTGTLDSQRATSTSLAEPEQKRPFTGKQLFDSYCGLCHGNDAKGGGPFSPQLKVWPPDLTNLTRTNGGVYPALHVSEIIDGEFGKAAHGSREMPIWGPVFRSMSQGGKDSSQRRIESLVRYLESLQQ